MNSDSVEVMYQANIWSGNFTTTPTSVLHFSGATSYAGLSFSNGWINNGKILFASLTTCQGTELTISAGKLVNAPVGIIQSSPNPYVMLIIELMVVLIIRER